jgi:hypothetical protein
MVNESVGMPIFEELSELQVMTNKKIATASKYGRIKRAFFIIYSIKILAVDLKSVLNANNFPNGKANKLKYKVIFN